MSSARRHVSREARSLHYCFIITGSHCGCCLVKVSATASRSREKSILYSLFKSVAYLREYPEPVVEVNRELVGVGRVCVEQCDQEKDIFSMPPGLTS